MNTHTLYCAKQKQRCPSPMQCGGGCCTKLNTANSDSSNPGYPFTWLDEILNTWDDMPWWQVALVGLGLIVVCGMVAGILVGYSK